MRASDSIFIAPWDAEELEVLNAYQSSGVWYPFTCFTKEKHADKSDNSVLIATEDGWKCPECDFRQNWSWKWMADKSRWPQSPTDGSS